MRRAASRAAWTAGSKRAINTAMIAITTNSSMSVKPLRLRTVTVMVELSEIGSGGKGHPKLSKPRRNCHYAEWTPSQGRPLQQACADRMREKSGRKSRLRRSFRRHSFSMNGDENRCSDRVENTALLNKSQQWHPRLHSKQRSFQACRIL